MISIHGKSRVVFGRHQAHVRYVPTQTVLHLPQSQNVVEQLLVASVYDLLELYHELLSESVLPDGELGWMVGYGCLLVVRIAHIVVC